MFRFVVHTHLIFLQNPRGKYLQTQPRVPTCFIHSLWNSMPSLYMSDHAFFPPGFLTCTRTLTRTHTHTDCPLDNTVRPLPCPCLGLPLFDNFICLFGYQQASRTQTLCLLYQSAVSRKLQPLVFAVCYFLES